MLRPLLSPLPGNSIYSPTRECRGDPPCAPAATHNDHIEKPLKQHFTHELANEETWFCMGATPWRGSALKVDMSLVLCHT